MRVLQLVDNKNYIVNNCFQHQLLIALQENHNVMTLSIEEILGKKLLGEVDVVISCLKQRTLLNNLQIVSEYLGNTPIVIYDQDPWEAFKDGSPYKGAYTKMLNVLNVKTFVVTTQWWVDYIRGQNMPCEFGSMWVLPRYCSSEPPWNNRKIKVGFIGTVHSYRFNLFESLRQNNVDVTIVKGNTLGYQAFMNTLSDIQIFVHSEDAPLTINGSPANMGTGLWIKDVEAAARGCFSIRNELQGHESYLSGIDTVKLYKDPSHVPAIIRDIQNMNSQSRQKLIDDVVQNIKISNRWNDTVNVLTKA